MVANVSTGYVYEKGHLHGSPFSIFFILENLSKINQELGFILFIKTN